MNQRQPEGKGKAGSAPEALPEAIVKKEAEESENDSDKRKRCGFGPDGIPFIGRKMQPGFLIPPAEGMQEGMKAVMKKGYILLIGRFIKEGLFLFIKLPLYMKVFGIGAAAAIWFFLIWMRLRRKEKLNALSEALLASLLLYLVFAFAITTYSRNPSGGRGFNIELFYTYRWAAAGSIFYAKMLFFNLVLLSPLGVLVPVILQYRCSWRDILFLAFLVSFFIECTQYLFRLGLMEADDLFYNCLGAMIGYVLISLVHGAALIMGKGISRLQDLKGIRQE